MNQAQLYWYLKFLNFLHRPLMRMVRKAGPDPYHTTFLEFQKLLGDLDSTVVLEIGSRNVMGVTRREMFPAVSRFIGFDVHPGDGVDVVGDAHELANYFEPNSIDAVMSQSVFEHLVFPWKVVLEINRVLKPGGYVYVGTHPVWPPHELPWDFWRYPLAGLSHLFIRDTGFEIIRAVEGLPCKVYSLVDDPPTRPFYELELNIGSAIIARKICDFDQTRLRWDVNIREAVKSLYPKPAPSSDRNSTG